MLIRDLLAIIKYFVVHIFIYTLTMNSTHHKCLSAETAVITLAEMSLHQNYQHRPVCQQHRHITAICRHKQTVQQEQHYCVRYVTARKQSVRFRLLTGLFYFAI